MCLVMDAAVKLGLSPKSVITLAVRECFGLTRERAELVADYHFRDWLIEEKLVPQVARYLKRKVKRR